MCLIFQEGYRPAQIVIPHFAAKQNDRPCTRMMRRSKHPRHIEWLIPNGLRAFGLGSRALNPHCWGER